MESNPYVNPQTPTNSSSHKMSSSLKRRLQKQGRYHGSRLPPKLQRKTLSWSPLLGTSPTCDKINTSDTRLNRSFPDVTCSPESTESNESKEKCCVSDSMAMESLEEAQTAGSDLIEATDMFKDEHISDRQSLFNESGDLTKKLAVWEKRIEEKEDLLRQLKMVKLYRTKNNLEDLTKMIVRWRSACQNALMEYREKCQDPVPSMTDVISHLQIDSQLIRYNPEDGGFID